MLKELDSLLSFFKNNFAKEKNQIFKRMLQFWTQLSVAS